MELCNYSIIVNGFSNIGVKICFKKTTQQNYCNKTQLWISNSSCSILVKLLLVIGALSEFLAFNLIWGDEDFQSLFNFCSSFLLTSHEQSAYRLG